MEVQFAISHEGSLISPASAVPLEPDAIPIFVIFKFGLPSRKSSCYQQKMRDISKSKLSAKKAILLYNNENLRISVVSEWFFIFEKNRCNFHNNKKVILVFYSKIVTKLCWSNVRLLWLLTKFEIEFTFIQFPTYRVHLTFKTHTKNSDFFRQCKAY